MPKKIINVAKMWLQNGYLPQLTREDIGWLQFFLEITWVTIDHYETAQWAKNEAKMYVAKN